ncbi:hypothetical protein ES703_89887 [subsurface metagenome]
MNNFFYTILTSIIILLSKVRNQFCNNKKPTAFLRVDRIIPWCPDYGKGLYYMGCCDCGLTHFIVADHSITPVRTLNYKYKLRFGAKAWHEPDPDLIDYAWNKAQEAGVIK